MHPVEGLVSGTNEILYIISRSYAKRRKRSGIRNQGVSVAVPLQTMELHDCFGSICVRTSFRNR